MAYQRILDAVFHDDDLSDPTTLQTFDSEASSRISASEALENTTSWLNGLQPNHPVFRACLLYEFLTKLRKLQEELAPLTQLERDTAALTQVRDLAASHFRNGTALFNQDLAYLIFLASSAFSDKSGPEAKELILQAICERGAMESSGYINAVNMIIDDRQILLSIEHICRLQLDPATLRQDLEYFYQPLVQRNFFPPCFTTSQASEGEDATAKEGDELSKMLLQRTYDRLAKARAVQSLQYFSQTQPRSGNGINFKELLQSIEPFQAEYCAQLSNHLPRVLEKDVLRADVSTVDVLSVYLSLISHLQSLDATLLEGAIAPIKAFLRTRDNTVRIILQSMLEGYQSEKASSDEYCAPIAKMMYQRDIEAQRHSAYFVGHDMTSLDWAPDGINANSDVRRLLASDSVGHLIEIQSTDVFISELQTVLAERLLGRQSFDHAKELELLAIFQDRFTGTELSLTEENSKSSIRDCEIMLRDVIESQQVTKNLPPFLNTTMQAKVLSQSFWPALRDEEFNFPPQMKEQLAFLGTEYQKANPDRRLKWLKELGFVEVELEFADRQISLTVSPPQAALLYAFVDAATGDCHTRDIDELANILTADGGKVRGLCNFWVSQRVLQEAPQQPGLFRVLETLEDEPTPPAGVVAAQETSAAAASALKSSAEVLAENEALYTNYIVTLLTNMGGMTADKILNFLKMVVPGGFPFEESDLSGFLEEMKVAGKVVKVESHWKIVA